MTESPHVSATAASTWPDALDEIEQYLGRAELLLRGSSFETKDLGLGEQYQWSAPCGLGPMPDALRSRALTLLARLDQTERALSEHAVSTSRRLASVNRPDPRRAASSGTRFDTSC